ncbi:MAG: hypothetical protein RQ733_08355 [Methyloprofundus sp.]|nr:hypothetical protein [Methyloprofundus sp.]
MKHRLKAGLITLLLTSLSACESGMFIRGSHSHHYHDEDHSYNQPISWGYTVGDPVLDTGHSGNFYPSNAYGQYIVHEGEGAAAP